MIEKLIEQLREDLKMEDSISTAENGRYRIPFEKDEIEVFEANRVLILKGVIGKRPEKHIDAFFLKAMEANLFGTGTRGTSIGLKEDGKLLTLTCELEYNSSYKDFKEKLEDMISVIDFWRNEAINQK